MITSQLSYTHDWMIVINHETRFYEKDGNSSAVGMN